MCCLFGLIDYGRRLTGKQKGRIVRTLAVQSEERGRDATGVAYNSRGRLHIYKRPLPAHKLYLMIPDDAAVMMGHTRMTTQGSEKRNRNNHPFLGTADGRRFALAHNGVLWNDKWLREDQKLPNTKIETDSYIAVQLLEKRNALDLASLKDMAEKVEGSFVFTVLEEDDTLSFVRGENPLCLYHYPQWGLYLYASTEAILNRTVKKLRLPLGQPEEIKVERGEIMQIDRLGRISKGRFDASKLDEWQYYLGGYTPGYASRRTNAEKDYVEQLKSVANACGYTPSAVDHLLQYGFAPEEIEEFLYSGEI